ncbi:DUF3885 domain-containing protein [Shimia sagamensis]|uniref:DUF3885 domain-containing protein n=1 Tax=Shimia sagamensis TaxID=1566352 RepID=A0ABY1P8B4_9RHOB|nr:DUF3885 domain-containing protein [Shimia sagamensis]SMP27315.1 protein of unknown function [Shimia sagamensis]
MTDIFAPFDHAFPCTEFSHALFFDWDHALRFELGGEGVPTTRALKRFNQALHRASTVAAALFQNTEELWLLTSYYGEKPRTKKRLKQLRHCGLDPANITHLGAVAQIDEDYIAEFGCDQFRFWDAFQLTEKSQLQEVLWLTLGAELGVHPRLTMDVYFVDFAQNLVLHPYDDRGMDVVAINKDALLPLYQRFGDWLLEWNRPEMRSNFDAE